MPNHDWIVYGATGYTGRAIVEEAARRGLRPILAGRNAQSIGDLAKRLGLEHRVFGLGDADTLRASIRGARLVLNCAGPFSATACPMMEACLAEHAHYLDITGEIDIIEAAAALDREAKAAAVILLPAVGFDVVPSDCLAAKLAARLPGASRLTLAFNALGSLSPGTAKTMLEAVSQATCEDRWPTHPGAAGLEDARRAVSRRDAHRDDDSLGRRRQRVLLDRHRQYRSLFRHAASPNRDAAKIAVAVARARAETVSLLRRLADRETRARPLGREPSAQYVLAVGVRRKRRRKSGHGDPDDAQRLFAHREHGAGSDRTAARGAARPRFPHAIAGVRGRLYRRDPGLQFSI